MWVQFGVCLIVKAKEVGTGELPYWIKSRLKTTCVSSLAMFPTRVHIVTPKKRNITFPNDVGLVDS
jgi:hypothetical protein